jgi:hypothetical protein
MSLSRGASRDRSERESVGRDRVLGGDVVPRCLVGLFPELIVVHCNVIKSFGCVPLCTCPFPQTGNARGRGNRAAGFLRCFAGLVVCIAPSEAQKKRCSKRTGRVSGKIVPTRVSSRQIHLMPFVEKPQQQSSREGNDENAQAVIAASQTDGGRQQKKNSAMGKLVPGRDHQINGEGLCAKNKQAERYHQYQQRRYFSLLPGLKTRE